MTVPPLPVMEEATVLAGSKNTVRPWKGPVVGGERFIAPLPFRDSDAPDCPAAHGVG